MEATFGTHSRSVRLPWTVNAAGYAYHNWYGFGALDLDAAVDFTRRYTPGSLGTFRRSGWFETGTVAQITEIIRRLESGYSDVSEPERGRHTLADNQPGSRSISGKHRRSYAWARMIGDHLSCGCGFLLLDTGVGFVRVVEFPAPTAVAPRSPGASDPPSGPDSMIPCLSR